MSILFLHQKRKVTVGKSIDVKAVTVGIVGLFKINPLDYAALVVERVRRIMFRGASLGYKSMSRCFFWQHKGRGLTADGRSRMIRTHMFMNNNKRYKSSPRALHLTPFPNRPLPLASPAVRGVEIIKGFCNSAAFISSTVDSHLRRQSWVFTQSPQL